MRASISFSLLGTLAGVLAKTKKFSSKRGTTLALFLILASSVVSSEQFWGIFQFAVAVDPNQEVQLALNSRNATAFPASDIYVVNGRASAHISELINLMGSHGLFFYKSSKIGANQGPHGLIARDDVVLIKINEQWNQRGGTNTDVLKELIQAIVDHPDGFVGEIVVADNGQGYGSMNWTQNNAEDYAQSTQDVVDMFSSSYKVSTYDWQPIRRTRVKEYSEGDTMDGYVLYDTCDTETGIYVSYPKFQTEFGTCISFKYGIWNGSAYHKKLKVINLPVLKSHFIYSVTASVKNYMGVQSEKRGGGLANGHDTVGTGGMGTLMVETRLPTLNIIDAIWVNANPLSSSWCGPRTPYGVATRVNVLMASTDPVAIDYWAARYILVQAARIIGYHEAYRYFELHFGRWLNLTRNEIMRGGYDVTIDEDHMNVYVYSRAYHDIEVTSIEPYRIVLSNDTSTSINVTVENKGDTTEYFNVTLYYNSNRIGTREVTLNSKESRILTFDWTTPALGNYTITAIANQVPGEVETEDNILTYGLIQISIPGDINADNTVNIVDLTIAATAFQTKPGDPKWNSNADLNEDGIINIVDLTMIARYYGKTA